MLLPGTGEALGRILYALFVRVRGGIYTKAAAVGAYLSANSEHGLEEDDLASLEIISSADP